MRKSIFNQIDFSLISLSIKVLSKSNYYGLDLASRVYDASFSNGKFIKESFGNFSNIKTMPCKIANFTKPELTIGDLLFFDNELYIVGEGNDFYDTNNHLKKVDYKCVIENLKNKEYALVRPSLIMPNFTPSKANERKAKLNQYQEAIIFTAESFFLRGDNMQYEDAYFVGAPEERSSFGKTPEYYTYQNTGYSNCAMFCHDVYYSTFNKYLPLDMWLTRNFATFAKDAKMEVYRLDLRQKESFLDEQKRVEIDKFLSTLQPADLINVRRYYRETGKESGHVMLYIGNGRFMHSTGESLVAPSKISSHILDPREATVRYHKVYDYLLNPNSVNYIFGGIISFINVIRPLASPYYAFSLPKSTRARVKNLKGIRVDKLSSHSVGKTVNVGDKISYTFSIFNTNNAPIILDISDIPPKNTTYIRGAERVENGKLVWRVMVGANQTKEVSYEVRVSREAKNGDIIYGKDALVGGVRLSCPAIFIENTLTKKEQDSILDSLKSAKNSLNTKLELANEIYLNALGKKAFSQTDERKLLIGKNGLFREFSQGYFEVNYKSPFIKTVIKNMLGDTFFKTYGRAMIGGCKLIPTNAPFIRTEQVTEHNLIVGDLLVILGVKDEVLIFIGDKKFINLTDGIKADELDFTTRCVRLFENDLFAILRPSMNF